MGDQVLERALLVELGHQLGAGMSSGATEITPEQQQALEATIDGLLLVAAQRTGKGLRTEVSPELREMVRKDIVDTLATGLDGRLGNSLESTVDRVVTRAITALRTGMEDERMRYASADLLRDSIYFAMRERQGYTPSVAETLQFTLEENVLTPMEGSVQKLTNDVAIQVNDSARRTENTLKTVIGALVLLMGVFVILYMVRGRQLRRAEERKNRAQIGLRSVDAALDLLDDSTRAQVKSKLDEFQQVAAVGDDESPLPEVKEDRGDDYMR